MIMTQRRAFLSFALATATIPFDIYGVNQWKKSKYNNNSNNEGIEIAGILQSQSSLPSSTSAASSSTSFIPISNLDDVVKQIETSVDRRFLHAVVASGYHQHLYASKNQVLTRNAGQRSTDNDNTNLVELERNQAEFWKDRPIQPSRCQLFVTDLDVARKRWGGSNNNDDIITVWPMMMSSSSTSTSSGRADDGGDHSGIHYAWPEKGGNFRGASAVNANDDSGIIVDGIDCGRMSLEDALEGNMEVLVQADQFLIVPLSMEEALIKRLKTSFLL